MFQSLMPPVWLFHHARGGFWWKSHADGVFVLRIAGGPSRKKRAQDDRMRKIGTSFSHPNDSTIKKTIAEITIHAAYCGPEMRIAGTRLPPTRTAIAFGAKLNQVIE